VSEPLSRWELAALDGPSHYGPHFATLLAEGADVDGEARLADVLLPRGGTVLDVGSGMGRVSASLVARGHRVTSIDPDLDLVAQSRATYPDLPVHVSDLLGFDPAAAGAPAAYDLVVCVGNVLTYLTEGTERDVLTRFRALLAPGGRVLAGFHLVSARRGARDYLADDFAADVAAAGLRVDSRWGSWDLRPPADDYGVWVLAADG
jgi:SAM-dependent methyltransferase